jgi:hypothetical protein
MYLCYSRYLHACTSLPLAEGQLGVVVACGYSHVPVLALDTCTRVRACRWLRVIWVWWWQVDTLIYLCCSLGIYTRVRAYRWLTVSWVSWWQVDTLTTISTPQSCTNQQKTGRGGEKISLTIGLWQIFFRNFDKRKFVPETSFSIWLKEKCLYMYFVRSLSCLFSCYLGPGKPFENGEYTYFPLPIPSSLGFNPGESQPPPLHIPVQNMYKPSGRLIIKITVFPCYRDGR